jgi:hypothetical protein
MLLKYKWEILTAGAVALFWVSWYCSFGYIPKTSKILLLSKSWIYGNWTITLPFNIPRWPDIVLAALFVNVSQRVYANNWRNVGLNAGVLTGVALGLLAFQASAGLLRILIIIAATILFFSAIDYDFGLHMPVGAGLGFWLGCGISINAIVGFAGGLILTSLILPFVIIRFEAAAWLGQLYDKILTVSSAVLKNILAKKSSLPGSN